MLFSFFFFNDTATTEIYTLSLHDALPILSDRLLAEMAKYSWPGNIRELENLIKIYVLFGSEEDLRATICDGRSEEHTSELQSQSNLVCRLLLEKKKKTN